MERLQERRAQAMDIFRQQKEVVEQRQRQQLLKHMREQEYESRSLDAVKDEYVLFLSLRGSCSSLVVYCLIVANDFGERMPYARIWRATGRMPPMKSSDATRMNARMSLLLKVLSYTNSAINTNGARNVNVMWTIMGLRISGKIQDTYLERVSWSNVWTLIYFSSPASYYFVRKYTAHINDSLLVSRMNLRARF